MDSQFRDLVVMIVHNYFIQNGETPLAYASNDGHVEAVHLLLDKGALINEVQHCDVFVLNLQLLCIYYLS